MKYVDGYVLAIPEANLCTVNAAVMQDPRLRKQMENAGMPFDMKRMFYGGFKSIVEF